MALVWANSPWRESYESLWATKVSISAGRFSIAQDLHHWVNDGLMVLFFFVVGLEIKRELVVGELNDVRKAMLPAFGALGGMVVPALIFAAFNLGGAIEGWGIPMATDIAFAVGVLALLGRRVPVGLKVFVLSLAIVDDIGAIAVIALFYSSGIELWWLLVSVFGLMLVAILRRVRVLWVPVYVVIGSGVWLAMLNSGVHATIAGVALGLMAPARPTDPEGFEDVAEATSSLSQEPDAESVRSLTLQTKEVVSVAERLEHLLHPWTSFLVIPLFALANAGVALDAQGFRSALASPVTMGVATGLVVGKIVGISGMSWLALRLRLGELPIGVSLRHLIGGAAVAGIGFTVSLFISILAFPGEELQTVAKIGVMLGSVVAATVGIAVLLREASNEGSAGRRLRT
jgi:NhaA family Na+:H+ antiporter